LLSKPLIQKTKTGFIVAPNEKQQQAKNGTTYNARIEAKLDLILEHLNIKF
jgi:hypothetical protein